MTLAQIVQTLKKSQVSLLGVSFVISVVVFVVLLKLPSQYAASTSLYIHNTTVADPASFSYDGYYAQLAAEGYTDTVVGLFETPELSQTIESAFLQGTYTDTPKITSLDVKKIAPQIVSVVYTSSDENLSLDMVTVASESVISLVSMLNEKDALKFSAQPLSDIPDIKVVTYSPLLFSIVFFLLVLIGGGLLVLINEYLRGNEQK